MKRKVSYVLAALCLLSGATILAGAKPGEPCTFHEDGVIYLCSGHDCICSSSHHECTGIKMKLMDEHPGEIEL